VAKSEYIYMYIVDIFSGWCWWKYIWWFFDWYVI